MSRFSGPRSEHGEGGFLPGRAGSPGHPETAVLSLASARLASTQTHKHTNAHQPSRPPAEGRSRSCQRAQSQLSRATRSGVASRNPGARRAHVHTHTPRVFGGSLWPSGTSCRRLRLSAHTSEGQPAPEKVPEDGTAPDRTPASSRAPSVSSSLFFLRKYLFMRERERERMYQSAQAGGAAGQGRGEAGFPEQGA